MSYGTYFPDQRHTLTLTTIRRERLLPNETLGIVEAREGERLDLRDVVVRGALPAHYHILEAAEFFGLKKPAQLQKLLLVTEGDSVEAGEAIAGKSKTRGRRLLAPVSGTIAHISDGRIILAETPEQLELEAGLSGTVISIQEQRGVTIETTGAVLQGVWGNGRVSVGPLRAEPDGGLESLVASQVDMEYRGAIVVTRRPLTAQGIQAISAINLSGIIAPSLSPRLVDTARQASGAIMLTEGFGDVRMAASSAQFLDSFIGRQATLDSFMPERLSARRPEVVINVPTRPSDKPPQANVDATIRVGTNVRLTRGDFAGQTGQIIHLPKTPYSLENGLRLLCVQVQLTTGDTAFVPLANLEVTG
jgi:hypothetical protein